MPPPPPHHGHAGRGGVTVMEVRAHNQEEELARIRELAHWFPFAAVAVCHDGPPAGAQTYPNTLEGSYEAVRDCVERATLARVALALASRDGELAMGGRVWRFHLGAGAGLADPLLVCAGIRAHAFAAMPRGALVTSDGAEDAAYLVRHILGGGALPRRRDEFLRACGQCFPELYDLRVLAEWTTTAGHPPPLAAAAAAGSSAFRAFLALAHGSWFCEVTTAYNAFLYGLGAADNDDLVRYKKMEAEYEESVRQARELLLQVHEEAYVNNMRFL